MRIIILPIGIFTIFVGLLFGLSGQIPTISAQIGGIETYKNRKVGAQTPVIEAIFKNDLQEVKNLWISARTRFHNVGNNGRSPLIHAVIVGNAEIAGYLLEKKAIIEQQDPAGNTALHYAAALNNTAMLKLLLDSGALINAQNFNGEIALFIAARKGGVESVIYLLDNDIRTDLLDYSGQGLREHAAESNNRNLLRVLQKRGL